MTETHKLDAELSELWNRRRDLDEAGWVRLYAIVSNVLRNYRPPELAGLAEDRDTYVQDFYVDKVFCLDSLSRCLHTGALRVYYRNYLRDELRRKHSRSKWEVTDKHDPESESPPSLDQAPEPETESRAVFSELTEAGLLATDVAASARKWLASNDEWVRIFVAYSNCPDATQSEPLVHLAKRQGIKSQAYKAEKLGFNWKSTDLDGFSRTLLGAWLIETLGIELCPEAGPLMLDALKILCFEALSWADQQETDE